MADPMPTAVKKEDDRPLLRAIELARHVDDVAVFVTVERQRSIEKPGFVMRHRRAGGEQRQCGRKQSLHAVIAPRTMSSSSG
jgi:hypothetical protein